MGSIDRSMTDTHSLLEQLTDNTLLNKDISAILLELGVCCILN